MIEARVLTFLTGIFGRFEFPVFLQSEETAASAVLTCVFFLWPVFCEKTPFSISELGQLATVRQNKSSFWRLVGGLLQLIESKIGTSFIIMTHFSIVLSFNVWIFFDRFRHKYKICNSSCFFSSWVNFSRKNSNKDSNLSIFFATHPLPLVGDAEKCDKFGLDSTFSIFCTAPHGGDAKSCQKSTFITMQSFCFL